MEILKDYEKKVLGLLVLNVLSPDQLNRIVHEGKLVGYEYTGCGYFLTITHELLPKERIVCDEPTLIGEVNGITCGFVIFIENGELTLECHSWGELDVTENFRNEDVQVKPVTIEDGKFVSLKQDYPI